jgi:hypothetical protein
MSNCVSCHFFFPPPLGNVCPSKRAVVVAWTSITVSCHSSSWKQKQRITRRVGGGGEGKKESWGFQISFFAASAEEPISFVREKER